MGFPETQQKILAHPDHRCPGFIGRSVGFSRKKCHSSLYLHPLLAVSLLSGPDCKHSKFHEKGALKSAAATISA
jgi:hypothetical protein